MATRNTTNTPVSLTAAQVRVLQAAAARQDGAVVLSPRLKGTAPDKLVAALMAQNFVREVRAKAWMPVHRNDPTTGRAYALVITKSGRSATPAEPAAGIAIAGGSCKGEASVQGPSMPDVALSHEGALKSRRRVPPKETASRVKAASAACETASGHRTPDTPPVVTTGEVGVAPTGAPSPTLDAMTGPDAPRDNSKIAAVIVLLGRETGASLDELITATGWLPHTTRAALTGLRKRGYAVERERTAESGTVYRIVPCAHAEAA